MTRWRLSPPSPRCDPTAVVPTATLRRVDDVTPGDDDAELEALEADLATIEDAMAKVDAGDLAGYEEATAGLGAAPAVDPSEQVGDGGIGDQFDPGAEGQPVT